MIPSCSSPLPCSPHVVFTEPTIAAAIAASGIPRNQLWITSKINVESILPNMTDALIQQVLTPLNTP